MAAIALTSTASGRPLAILALDNGSSQQQLRNRSPLPLRTDFQLKKQDAVAPDRHSLGVLV
ncbi:hypothetical protein D1831_08495 [Lactiplantibacillus garii]|uniref:Uncharacterized protein n=1 Tax=Lactiplantibacillus garii TaxID=2306423 RepID=A0A426D6N0_9LACO|nr:hypothetical protein D1831_08495 [Lactiplantibacillus garii]